MTQLSDVRRGLDTLKRKGRELEAKKGQVRDFLRFDDFAAIDWRGGEQALQELRQQKMDLEGSSDKLRQLRAQLEAIQGSLKHLKARKDEIQEEKFGFERDIQARTKQQQQVQERLEEASPEELRVYSPHIEARSAGRPLTLGTLDAAERRTQEGYRTLLAKDDEKIKKLQVSIIRKMQNYKNAYVTETTDIDSSIESLDDFEATLEAIKKDDLPRLETQFKSFLNDKILSNVVVFRAELERRSRTIKETIDVLNGSLRDINYTPKTFIELRYSSNPGRDIGEFQRMLKACFDDVGRSNELDGNASFGRIRALIERFETDVRWTKKVTDVRNWLDFSASENYRVDGSQRHHYADSSGKSGGQKAKLAYTILASAIAYQFGLDRGQARSTSFRFVVIDEAFDKTDERNAHYAMELFKQLNLQLLVVTPLDKIHIIEPFISACHYV